MRAAATTCNIRVKSELIFVKGGSTHGMFKVKPKLRAIALCVHANAGTKMPLAQAHPFQPMPVTHEESDAQEVSERAIRTVAALAAVSVDL